MAGRKIVTQKSLDAIKPTAQRQEIPDSVIKSLYYIVQPSGNRGWALRYRHGERSRKYTIGPYPMIGLSDAREAARKALELIEIGRDPAIERELAREQNLDPDNAIEKLVETFLERHGATVRASSAAEYGRLLRNHVVPRWAGRGIRSISRKDVVSLLDSLVAAGIPVSANRTLAVLKIFFRWALEREIVNASPAAAIKMPAPESAKDRVLSDAELSALWEVAGREAYPWGPALKLLVLTAQRRDEVGEAVWSEFDLKRAIWTIPAPRAKNGREHQLSLGATALVLLDSLPRRRGVPYLFSTKQNASSGWSRMKRRLDASMLEILRNGDPAAELPKWTLHDIRRTVATGMARIGVFPHTIEAALNHVTGSRSSLSRVYNRHAYAAEIADALQRWEAHLLELVKNQSA